MYMYCDVQNWVAAVFCLNLAPGCNLISGNPSLVRLTPLYPTNVVHMFPVGYEYCTYIYRATPKLKHKKRDWAFN